jgi:hypothetical protein
MENPRSMTIPSIPYTAVLVWHPSNASNVVRGIGARVCWAKPGLLALTCTLKGDLARLRIPPFRTSRRTDRLWEHTCLEVFISARDSTAYSEFNFSPSGEWAAYAFRAYRDGGPIENDDLDPQIVVRREADTLELSAVIRLDRLSAIPSDATLRLGLSAVVEELDGSVSYWALKHPPGKPDFHHPDNFILEIKPPGVAGSDAIAYTGKP